MSKETVSAETSTPLSPDEYEIDESVSRGSKGRFHRLTGSRQTKLTMNGQLTWRLCQLTAMADELVHQIDRHSAGWTVNRCRMSNECFEKRSPNANLSIPFMSIF